MVNSMFIDTQDPTRLVKITDSVGNHHICRVYFRNLKNLRQEPQYYGQTSLPQSLFDASNNRNVLFVHWDREAELEKQRQIEELQKKKFFDLDEEFDYEDE